MRRFALLSLTMLLPVTAVALQFGGDESLEREAFSSVRMWRGTVTIEDVTDDVTVFDRTGQRHLPPSLADLLRVTVTPEETGWNVAFQTQTPLPEDPGASVNYQVFAARAGMPVAPVGVYRAGSNVAALLLYGWRTKWHAQMWEYDGTSGRWNRGSIDPDFAIDPSGARITIPYTELPADSTDPLRVMALTSTGGVTAVDVAPGTYLPPVRGTTVAATQNAALPWSGIVIAGGVVLAALLFAFRKKR